MSYCVSVNYSILLRTWNNRQQQHFIKAIMEYCTLSPHCRFQVDTNFPSKLFIKHQRVEFPIWKIFQLYSLGNSCAFSSCSISFSYWFPIYLRFISFIFLCLLSSLFYIFEESVPFYFLICSYLSYTVNSREYKNILSVNFVNKYNFTHFPGIEFLYLRVYAYVIHMPDICVVLILFKRK